MSGSPFKVIISPEAEQSACCPGCGWLAWRHEAGR
jgi:hypothetical protein